MNYRRDIDGLRAVAVLAVMLFHAGFSAFAGGYVGVDVFLVISGYLITHILLEDIRGGRFSLRSFYDRRARRLLPALFVVLLASSVAALAVLTPREMVEYSKSLMAVAAFGANLFFWRDSGYFEGAAELKPLLHTWSLAVEEQYYILFPLLLLALLRWCRSGRQAAGVLLAVGLASFVLAAWGSYQAPRASFFLLPARAWELLLGAGLAAWGSRQAGPEAPSLPRWLREGLAISGLALIALAIALFDDETPFPGVHALLPTGGAALLILHARGTATGRLLASPLLVGIGLVSYSAYLWHQPLLAFFRVRLGPELPALQAAALCAAALALAFLSWRYVEQPFRRRGVWREQRVLAGAAAGLGLFLLLGLAGVRTQGFERLYVQRLDGAELALYAMVKQHTAGTMFDQMVDDGQCRFWSPQVTPEVLRRYQACTAGGRKALVVLGDSHGMNIYNALARAQAAPVVVGFTQPGCQPHRPRRECHYQAFEEFAAAHRASIDRIIYHQSGSYLILDDLGAQDSDRAFADQGSFSVADAGIVQVHEYLNRLSDGGRVNVTWLGPFLEPRRDMRDHRALQRTAAFAPRVTLAFETLEARIAPMAAGPSASYRYVPMLRHYLGPADALLQGQCLLFRDKDHLSPCGEGLLGERLKGGLL